MYAIQLVNEGNVVEKYASNAQLISLKTHPVPVERD